MLRVLEREPWRCQAHDVVFQLTDTRESRWLPTVLATMHRKLTINVALGFDTYLAMRHGIPPAAGASPLHCLHGASLSEHVCAGELPNLGCYFCNDAAAELHDSMKASKPCTACGA